MAKIFNSLRIILSLNNNQLVGNYGVVSNVSSILNSFNCISKEHSLYSHLHTSVPRSASSFKHRDRRDLLKSVSKPDDGTEGEKAVSVDASIKT